MKKTILLITILLSITFCQDVNDCSDLQFKEYESSQFRADLESYALRFDTKNISSDNYRLLSAESGKSIDLPINFSIEFLRTEDSFMYVNLTPEEREQYYSKRNLEEKQWWEYVGPYINISVVKDINNVTMKNSSQFEFSRNKFNGFFHNFMLKGEHSEQTILFAQKLIEYEAEPNSGLIVLFQIDNNPILLIVPLCAKIEKLKDFL